MTLSPLKPKRSAGGFFSLFSGQDGIYWIEENYHLYKRDSDSDRDRYYVDKDRKAFVNASNTVKFKFDNRLYVVMINCDISHEVANKIMKGFHDGKTRTINFDDI